jgi:DNA-binding GntR family transcriptional regulator
MPVPVTPIERRSLLRDDAYSHLLGAIVSGTLAPGEQLRDAELAQWLGVSRTPIREAVLRLGQIGLVSAQPGRATFVSNIDPEHEQQAKSVLASMHRLAVEESLNSLTTHHWDQLSAANKDFATAINRRDIESAIIADDAFHRVFIEASGNAATQIVVDTFTPLIRRAEIARFSSNESNLKAESSSSSTVLLHDSAMTHDLLVGLAKKGSLEAGQVAYEIWNSLPNSSPK